MMKKYLIIISILLFSLFSINTFAQNEKSVKTILKQTNVNELEQLSKRYEQEYIANKQRAIELAKQKGFDIKKQYANGKLIELQGISETGKPIYYVTHNIVAAKTVSTNKVWSNDFLGLDLNGTDMIVGEWDGGAVRSTHQEFTNTGVSRVTQKDYGGATHYHATHVAGTLVAGGVKAKAKGMAYNANLYAYEWNNDASEMATAASNGLLISNHSYGIIAGWSYDEDSGQYVWYGDESISNVEDYRFGLYDYKCVQLDNIANNAPYYLICKSAGNDRGDGPGSSPATAEQDGGNDGFDCISSKGNAKNILTVGAVEDLESGYTGNPADVKMTDFSSWGPADDSRIKPDICANGSNLFSTFDGSNDDYSSISGTSMSCPSATGSLLLLQEYYFRTHGTYLKAATLKALAIHTADECGPNEGPDYMFGWGLLNTESAAMVISNDKLSDLIIEEEYNSSTYTYEFTAKGNEPLVVTVVWSDATGSAAPYALDPPDKMLVNDLDITVSNAETTYYPYMLDGANPANAATTGDNDSDNVEKVFVANPDAGEYTLTITHEGTISGSTQPFSLIVSGIIEVPVVLSSLISDVSTTTALVSTTISNQSSFDIQQKGVVYGDNYNPTFDDNVIFDITTELTFFNVELSGLLIDKIHHARSFVIDATDTIFSKNIRFRTEQDYPYFESFENGMGKWEQPLENELDWIIYTGATDSDDTGPSSAFDGTYYLYVESQGNSNLIANIQATFNLTELESPKMNFYYHMFGGFMGDLYVDVKHGDTWDEGVFELLGEQQTSKDEEYLQAAVDLSSYGGQNNITIRFRADVGSFSRSDIAIDKIEIENDLIAPEIVSLTMGDLGATWAKVKINTNEGGYGYFLVSDNLSLNPTKEEILAGIENTIESDVENVVVINNLIKNTLYKVFVVAKDVNGNVSDINELTFTTLIDGITYDLENNIKLYPNPNNGRFTLELAEVSNVNAEVSIVDAMGRVVFSELLKDNLKTFEFFEYPKGLYHMQIKIEENLYGKNFIIK
ncbi:MAG: S8 family serine peptidase [Salinivirgaceae bacterium]|nr:S8 family serine peptidase [Salinivirgaceae bacterium]